MPGLRKCSDRISPSPVTCIVVRFTCVTPYLRQFPGIVAYCMSKSAVDQLTRCAALELADRGVRVNAVNPGVIITDLHKRAGMDSEKYKQVCM